MSLPATDHPDGSPRSGSTPRMNAEMNVTPMLDVLLVLLIIFMAEVTRRHIIETHLPEPAASQHADAVPIVLEVGPRGQYVLNRQVIAPTALATRLQALYAERPDKRIILQGAREATYDEVLHAIDIAKGAGVTIIGVDTRSTLRAPIR